MRLYMGVRRSKRVVFVIHLTSYTVQNTASSHTSLEEESLCVAVKQGGFYKRLRHKFTMTPKLSARAFQVSSFK
jgi:hypothetical protein